MDMQKRLQELADAIEARNASQARALLARFFDEGTFVELDGLARDGDHPAEAAGRLRPGKRRAGLCFRAGPECLQRARSAAPRAAKIRRIYDLAAQNGAPVVGVFDSDGAGWAMGSTLWTPSPIFCWLPIISPAWCPRSRWWRGPAWARPL